MNSIQTVDNGEQGSPRNRVCPTETTLKMGAEMSDVPVQLGEVSKLV
jgi:hypothetical protein